MLCFESERHPLFMLGIFLGLLSYRSRELRLRDPILFWKGFLLGDFGYGGGN